jgi:CheY-like chemotaxis protein
MQGLRTKNIKALGANILVVDDELFNLEIIAEYLEDADYIVDTAVNGTDAWELIKANPKKYHVVLLDRMMPDMDGLEILKRMKSDPTLQFIPVVLQTAKTTKAN